MNRWRKFQRFSEQPVATTFLHSPLNFAGLSRSIRQIDQDTIEVVRFDNGWHRLIVWLLFAITFYFGIVQAYWEDNNIWGDISIFLNSENYFHEQYLRWIERGSTKESLGTFTEFYQGMMQGHGHRWKEGLFFISLPSLSLLFCLFWPRYRPIRFNRKHRIAYTWVWGRFYLTRIDQDSSNLELALRNMGAGYFSSKMYGALMMSVQRQAKPKNLVRQPMGVYPPTHAWQNQQIAQAIHEFINDARPPTWLNEIESARQHKIPGDYVAWFRAFVNFSFFRAGFSKRTEQRIAAYLAEWETKHRRANTL
jgi:hypothetical protein